MNWKELEHKLNRWRLMVYVEQIMSHPTRRILKNYTLLLAVVSLLLASEVIGTSSLPEAWLGPLFLCLFLYLTILLIECFFYSNFFSDFDDDQFGPELACIVGNTNKNDVTLGFISSVYGRLVLDRLLVYRKPVKEFLRGRKNKISSASITFPNSSPLLTSYLTSMLEKDQEFETFLAANGVTKEVLIMCTRWVMTRIRKHVDNERWWSEARLSKIDSLGSDWSFGKAYFLSRFSTPLRITTTPGITYHDEEAIALETILSKDRESNALIIGEEGIGKIEIIEILAQKIERGYTSPTLKHQKFVVFGTAAFIASMSQKQSFEVSLLKVFDEACAAGNIILVIPDFSNLVHAASVLGTDLASLLDPFLASEELHVVAIVNNRDFHMSLESNQVIMQRFDTILVKSGSQDQILSVIQNDVAILERREKIFFSYQAILEAVSSAAKFFVEKALLDTSLDLLAQAVAKAKSEKRKIVSKEDVMSIIHAKTGVPVGDISPVEQDKLTHLEELLHERIIGQDEAITSISNALRRARAGIANPNRPMGSFLFLGPTGVGKTETTKALAAIFFGGEEKTLRLDMSEYNTPDALNRLIGGAGESGGILATMIREHPYSVLLLDEFEKTDKKVLDLFLQILDEGIFSDASGNKVSARNLIIVATSNAGSEMIFDIVKSGETLVGKKDKIIEEIIKQNIYKPELINRFDGLVVFHPLEDSHLRAVARIMLEKLTRRLEDQGITLNVNDSLINFLVSKGNDPKFGARPLNRAIQDTVEKVIANKMIAGELKSGSELTLTEEDLQ